MKARLLLISFLTLVFVNYSVGQTKEHRIVFSLGYERYIGPKSAGKTSIECIGVLEHRQN
jgi:hypothetical protein